MSNFNSVKKFMETFGQEVKSKAEFPDEKIQNLRVSLIEEELSELKEAIKNKDIKEVADALTDILYVTYGAGHAFGIDLDQCFDEVQRSNMSKLDESGKPIFNEYGKILKGPNYFKPNLEKFVKIGRAYPTLSPPDIRKNPSCSPVHPHRPQTTQKSEPSAVRTPR